MQTTISIDTQVKGPQISAALHSQFIEFLGECIYGGIWVGEDSEIPNYNGFRKDTLEALKEIAPPVIRWPGGCYADTYHWRDGIGPREKRPVTYNENFGTYELDTNQFGTHEFMELCRLLGAKPWININMMTGTSAEMREWMEYCNRKEETNLAKERKENGSEESFNVEYWGIGNEVWGGGGIMTPETYVAKYREYATACPQFVNLEDLAAMQQGAAPKLSMKRIASGPDGNKPKERVQWTKDFFAELGKYRTPALDGYDLHFYNWDLKDYSKKETDFDEEDWNRVIESCFELEDVILEQAALIREGIEALPEAEGQFPMPKPNCELIVGEWGNWYGSAFVNRPALYQQCTMRDAITTALTLDIFHRNCDTVKMACVAQTVNVLNSLILTDGASFVKTPNFDVFAMYKVHRDAYMLPVIEKTDNKDAYVFASEKEDKIFVNLVNANMRKTQEITLEFSQPVTYVSGEILHGDDPHAHNTSQQPDCVRKKASEAPEKEGEAYRISLPEASVSVLIFQK